MECFHRIHYRRCRRHHRRRCRRRRRDLWCHYPARLNRQVNHVVVFVVVSFPFVVIVIGWKSVVSPHRKMSFRLHRRRPRPRHRRHRRPRRCHGRHRGRRYRSRRVALKASTHHGRFEASEARE